MDVKAFVIWLAIIIGIASALAPLVSSFVAAIKTAAGSRLSARYYPTVALAVGIALAEFVTWILPANLAEVPLTWREALLVGALAGLMAAKLYEHGKQMEIYGPKT